MGRTPKVFFVFIFAFPSLLVALTRLGKNVAAAPTDFIFTASRDYSANSSTSAALDLLSTSGTSFTLALGDFSYSQLVPESAWCDYVKSHVGGTFPLELLSDNHEDDGPQWPHRKLCCLPDRLDNITGEYAREYYFDYPVATPLDRFILMLLNHAGRLTLVLPLKR